MQKGKILNYFKRLCEIPHCSFETDEMTLFLADFARNAGCDTRVDAAGNIRAVKGSPKICLQAHYDMVCMGEAPRVRAYLDEQGFLRAHNSSLGADNGIGAAIAMSALEEFENIECLFTNNEEVGMLGAEGFAGDLAAKYLLNLDSEDENEVIVGCAGGVNIFAKISSERVKCDESALYEVKISGLCGGHSGVEIHKNIPNAIKILARFIAQSGARLADISGGERSNSIPANARASVLLDENLAERNFIRAASEIFGVNLTFNGAGSAQAEILGGLLSVKKRGRANEILANGERILSLINSFAQGVRAYDASVNSVLDSINLSILKCGEDGAEVEFFARSMSESGLERLEFETVNLARALGFSARLQDRSAPWTPAIGEFAREVASELARINPNVKISAIHAGLECGVLLQKQPDLQACSIGPNIFSPHSVNERCEAASVERIAKAVRAICAKFQ